MRRGDRKLSRWVLEQGGWGGKHRNEKCLEDPQSNYGDRVKGDGRARNQFKEKITGRGVGRRLKGLSLVFRGDQKMAQLAG